MEWTLRGARRTARRGSRLVSGAAALPLFFSLLLVAAIAGAAGTVHPTAEDAEPLAVGARVPSVRVETVLGEAVDLAGVVRDHGALLVFYRGGW